jgi:hypothetical protein
MVEFEQLVAEGLRLDVEAYWGAGLLPERLSAEGPSWSYTAMARSILSNAQSALDMGTGEGGVLRKLGTVAQTDGCVREWWPTVPAAQERLKPLGVHLVVTLGSADNVGGPDLQRRRPGLPFEIFRIIKPGGRFLTQQVGSDEAASVRTLLGLPIDRSAWAAAPAIDQLQPAGWAIDDVREDRLTMKFADIAALIGYVRTIPWAYQDLDWARVKPRLQQLHFRSQSDPIEAISHHFLVLARA